MKKFSGGSNVYEASIKREFTLVRTASSCQVETFITVRPRTSPARIKLAVEITSSNSIVWVSVANRC